MASLTNVPATPFRFQSALFTVLSPPTRTMRPTVSVAGPSGEAEWQSPATTATATASTVATPAGRADSPSAGDLERFRNAYTIDPVAELSRIYPTQTDRSHSDPEPATHLTEPVREPIARIPSPPWRDEVRPSKKRKTATGASAVTQQVAKPWAGREEGGEATVPVSAPRRNPARNARKPVHIDTTTTARTTGQKGRAKPTRSGRNGKPVKAGTGKPARWGGGVESDEARSSEGQRKPVAWTEKAQKRNRPKKDTRRAQETTGKGVRVNLVPAVTAQRLHLVDKNAGCTSSGEEEVD